MLRRRTPADPSLPSQLLEPSSVTTTIRIRRVTGPHWQSDQHRAELPTINGVRLHGPHLINPVRHILNPRPYLNPSRAGGGDPSDTTRRYLNEAITAVMIHYTARPQTRTGQRHYARTTAPASRDNLNTAILNTARRLAATRAELTRLQDAALALAHLGGTN